jgi:HAD superfamily hydrolase (TIGR01490 family)
MNLTLFDLDNTLLPLDSDYEWGQFLCRAGAVEREAFTVRNDAFYQQYVAGTLNPVEYLEFAFGTLKRFPRSQLDDWHAQFMQEVIQPAMRNEAIELVEAHRQAGDLLVIITATNRFVTGPIAQAFGVEHLIAAEPEFSPDGEVTGRLVGRPPFGIGKVSNLHDWLGSLGKTLADFERSTFYSDSQNDIPLLSVVTHPVATNPNAALASHAESQGWPVLQLFPVTDA